MLSFEDKQKLKNFLYKRRKMVTDSPFYFTERFCKISSLDFKEILKHAIEWQQKFKMEIRDEKDFIFTIL